MIENKTANVVVLGLGYVGLPVACLFAEAGFPVVGIRRSQDKVEMINRGVCPIEGKEPGLAELLARVVTESHFRATTDYEVCREAQIVLIAVETPVDPVTKKPGYQALRGALTDLGYNLSRFEPRLIPAARAINDEMPVTAQPAPRGALKHPADTRNPLKRVKKSRFSAF